MNSSFLRALGLCLACALLMPCLPGRADLVAYYTFDIDARDFSSFSNNGTIVGAQIVSGGVSGNACEFDGIDDCIVVPHQDFLASPQFTVSAWIKSRVSVVGLERGAFGKHREHDNVSYYWIYQRTNELWSTMVGSSYGLFCDVTTSVSSVAGTWGMVTLTYDGGTMRMYVNGSPVGQKAVEGYAGNSYDFLIGAGEWSAFSDSPQRWWNGWIDEFSIYDQALSDAEVLALYQGNTFTTQVGAIQCTLGPQGALDAGAAWRLSTDSLEHWRPSGSTAADLAPGAYEVVFKDAGGYVRPQSRQVVVQAAATSEVAVTYSPMPNSGLVLHYNFDQAPGAYVQDLSGMNNSGLVVGAAQSADSHSGFAYEFNGSSDYIRVRNSPSLMSTQFTAVAWAKSREPMVSIERGILGKHREHDNITYYWIYQLSGTNILRGTMVGSSFGAFRNTEANSGPFVNQWGTVALTYDGAVMRLYVNCVLVDEEAVAGFRGNTYDLLVGAGEFANSGASPQRWWNGWIDDVRIYNRALSADEISLLCEGTTNEPPKCGSLTCTLSPQGVVDSGGRWRLSTESADTGHASGYTMSSLPTGTYQVVFKSTLGWVAPSPAQVTVAENQQTNVVGVYTYASTNRLVLYYPCDDPPITPVIDYSGYGNHGTASNVTFDPAGYSNGCYAFNGTNSFITAPDDDSYDTLQFTITMWAKSRDPSPSIERGILGKHREAYNTMYYWVYQVRSSSVLRATMVGNVYNDFRNADGSSTPLVDTWGMVTLTYDGTNMTLYVNGQMAQRTPMSNYTGNAYNLLVGAGEWSMYTPTYPQRWWNGWIDEVRIYSYAMDSNEVRTVYEGNASVDVIAPEILKISPPNRHVTSASSINMNIFVSDNVGVTEVTVNGNPADVIGSGIWHYHQKNLDDNANHFTVVARDAVGNCTTQEVVYFRGGHLRLTAMWDGYWRVRNPNTFDVPYTWDVYQTTESGTGTVAASSDDFFETSTGPKTVRLFVDGIQQDVKTWNPSPKVKADQGNAGGGGEPLKAQPAGKVDNPPPDGESAGRYGTLSWLSVTSQTYRVFSSSDLVAGVWEDLVPPAVYTGDGSLIVHTNPLPAGGHVFYMLEVSNIATNL